MSLTAEEQAYFDAIDEMPMRRSGGFIVSIDGSKPGKGAEFRSCEQAEHRSSSEAFPRLEHEDGTPADPPTLHTVVPNWRAGDEFPLGPGRSLRVIEIRSGEDADVLVVESA